MHCTWELNLEKLVANTHVERICSALRTVSRSSHDHILEEQMPIYEIWRPNR
jgi:endonuclease III